MSTPNVWHDETNFFARVSGQGWGIVLTFPIDELAQGASLAAMMTKKTRTANDGKGWTVDPKELRAAGKAMLPEMRAIIEPYFAARGIGEAA